MTGPDNHDRAAQLKAIVERLEALDEEAAAINADKRAVRKEAKDAEFDLPTIAAVLKRRKLEPEAVIEADAMLEAYEITLGCGAAAGGTLQMSRNAAGIFEAAIVSGPVAAEEKLTRAAKARQAAVTLAELSRRARMEE